MWNPRNLFAKTPTPIKKETPPLNEVAWTNSSLMYGLFGGFDRYNPDDLVQKKGANIYRQMLRDPQVKAAYNLKVNIIISRNYRFEKTNDDPIQDEIIDFFNANISYLIDGTWIKALRAIMLGKAYGFSVSEKIYDTRVVDGKDRWIIKAIKAKPYDTFQFKIDNFGNLTTIIQEQDSGEKKLNPEKFIIYINMPDLDPVWGESDLRAVYRPYWEKDVILKFWDIYLERMAGGFLIVTPDKDSQTSLSNAQKANFENVLKNLSMYTAIQMPQGYDAKLEQGADTQAFKDAISAKDQQIARGLILPDLLGFSDRGNTGSRSLGETQLDTYMMTLNEDGDYLADICNEQVFAQLAEWNFGVDEFPRFKFDPYTQKQKEKIAAAWVDAQEKGAVINTFDDETRTRELLTYPLRDEENTEAIIKDQEEPEQKEEPKPEEKEPIIKNTEPTIDFAESVSFVDRIDPKRLKQQFQENEESFENELSKIVDRQWVEIKAGINKTYADLPKNRDKIDFTNITNDIYNSYISAKSKSDMNRSIQNNLRGNYDFGRKEAQKTIKQSLRDAPEDVKAKVKSFIALSPKTISKKVNYSLLDFVEGITLQQAANWFSSEAFKITKDMTDDMLSTTQEILMNGLRDDKSSREVIQEIEDALPTFLGTKEDREKRARIENIVRTNISSIYNQAQMAVYNDPALGDFVEAFQYSAVLDSRTTNFCEAYSGRIFAKNDPIWGIITPPSHYSCRSVVVPVTALDVWKESNKVKINPSPGFGGKIEDA